MNGVDIKHADFRRIDLNLLVALDALLTECHVGRAAERLFIGQPAMSHALTRLRALFGDELLVRTGRQMAPTALAQDLAPRVRAWLGEGLTLMREQPFEPAQAQGLLRLSIPDGLEAVVLPSLLQRLRRDAPGVSVRVQLVEVDHLPAALDAEELDLAVVVVGVPTKAWHVSEAWLSCGFNYMYCPNLLPLTPSATLAELAQHDHVISSYRGEAASSVDKMFMEQGLTRRVVASLGSFRSVLDSVRQAPLVTIQPAMYLGLQGDDSLVVAPLQTASPLVAHVRGVWHSRNDQHGLHRYIRGLVRDGLQRLVVHAA